MFTTRATRTRSLPASTGLAVGVAGIALLLGGCAAGGSADGPSAGEGPGGNSTTPVDRPVPLTGSWLLVSGTDEAGAFWPGADGTEENPVTLNLGDDGGLGGVASCNTYGLGGEVEESDQQPLPMMSGDIDISDVFSTMMYCDEPIMDVENRYLEALRNVDLAERDDSTLVLSSDDHELIFEVAPEGAGEVGIDGGTVDGTDSGTGDGTE